MPEEERRISPAVVFIPVGLGLGAAAAATLYALAQAAPPTPPPGLANLYGQVTDADTGGGIPDALVTLDAAQTYTDDNGNYAFVELEPGGYYISFQKEGYDMVSRDITLVEGNNEVNVQMTPVVKLASVFGVVTEADLDSLGNPNPNAGQPIAAASVGLWSPDGVQLLGSTITDSSGAYSMANILPGNYLVRVEKEGYEPETR